MELEVWALLGNSKPIGFPFCLPENCMPEKDLFFFFNPLRDPFGGLHWMMFGEGDSIFVNNRTEPPEMVTCPLLNLRLASMSLPVRRG